MKILITGAAGPLAQSLAVSLRRGHELRLLDSEPVTTEWEFLQGDLRNEEDCRAAVADREVVIHLSELRDGQEPEGLDRDQALLDWHTRGTYHLMKAAVAAGVKQFVHASTLEVLGTYPAEWTVTEGWKPRPPTEAGPLARYAEELILREFSREGPVRVVCLRLGRVVREQDVQGQPFDPWWVEVRDVVHAFRRTLSSDYERLWATRSWWVFHILSNAPGARFMLKQALDPPLEYHPLYDFRAWWYPEMRDP
jgi:nucleoside-diphosphate-sugar epimerase